MTELIKLLSKETGKSIELPEGIDLRRVQNQFLAWLIGENVKLLEGLKLANYDFNIIVIKCIQKVQTLHERAGKGETVTDEEWSVTFDTIHVLVGNITDGRHLSEGTVAEHTISAIKSAAYSSMFPRLLLSVMPYEASRAANFNTSYEKQADKLIELLEETE